MLEPQAEIGECPLWDASDVSLLLVDASRALVHRYRPAIGTCTTFATAVSVGSLALCEDGDLALADGFARCGPSGERLERFGRVWLDPGLVRFNDGKVDPSGRFLAGTMHVGEKLPVGALYQLAADGAVERLVEGVTISNGLGWAESGRVLHYVDSATHGVDADPATGALSGRRRMVELAECAGLADGMAIDDDGCLWLALFGGARVDCFTPAGDLDRTVPLPTTNVTSVAFGGPRLNELYITTARIGLGAGDLADQPHAGDLLVVDPGVTGPAPSRFAARRRVAVGPETTA